jgi:Zn-dependent protease with chaperone function
MAAPADSVTAPRHPESRQEFQAEILTSLSGEIEPVRVSWTYSFAALLVALVMVLLPLIYLVLIALVACGMYYHAIYDVGIIVVRSAVQVLVLSFMLYLAPLVAGVIMVFFMFKPLLARPEKTDRRRSLSRQGEPLLFDFVERICALVGAPAPRRIDVNCELNAAASFRRGWLSLVMPADLVVTIGMPLVAGLSMRQFAGVLAHEFGHFTQGAGMRLTYVIRSISWWLTRVVYQRDTWDARLEYWAENSDWRIALVLHFARLSVWLTRRVLWVLMILGHGVAGFMLRQMELDADRYEARLIGSETYEATFRRLAVLAVATKGAFADLGDFYREGHLGDNLPKLILANLAQIPEDVHVKISGMIDQSKTGWLDTHPADSVRIVNARRENSAGIFHYDASAAALFSDFDALARNVTWDYYRGVLRAPSLKPSDLHPVDDLIAQKRKGNVQQS